MAFSLFQRKKPRRVSADIIRPLRRNDGVLLPFLLEGVAADPALNQADGIHPTAEGQRIVAENVWTALRPMLE